MTGDTTPATHLRDAALGQASLRLYLDNPFRSLGISVLSNSREIARRADELRLAARLQLGSAHWAFAPAPEQRGEATRAAIQFLNEAPRRLVAEFFWFWPEQYPEAGPDVALEHLAHGDIDAAVAEWAGKNTGENAAVLHNLALYHHLMALEQEQSEPPLPADDLAAWWSAALRYWQLLLNNEELWQRLGARVQALDDAQLPANSAEILRQLLPQLLGSIQARLAFRQAEARQPAAAARHVALLSQIHTEPAEARRALELAVSPVVQRLNARLAPPFATLPREAPAAAINAASELVENCLPDIHLLNTLCGGGSDLAAELTTRFAQRVVEELQVPRLHGAGAAGAMAPLAYVRSLPLPRETSVRINDVFQTLLDQALAGPDPAEETEPDYARLFRFLSDQIVPRFFSLNVGEVPQRECAEVLAGLLRLIAREAVDEREDIAFALHAYNTLLVLPSDAATRSRREAEKESFHRDALLRKARAVRLELAGRRLIIDARGIEWNGAVSPLAEITALRFGRRAGDVGGTAPEGPPGFVAAWQSQETEYVLDASDVFADPTQAAALHATISEAIRFFIAPAVVEKMVAALRADAALDIGGKGITREGAWLETGSRLFRKEERVPLQKLKHWVEDGILIVASRDNPKLQGRFSLVETWNAVLLEPVIEALTLPAAPGS